VTSAGRRTAIPQLKESDVQSQVRDFLRARGWRPVRTQFSFSPGSFSTGEPGMADYLFLYPLTNPHNYAVALALWCEFKSPRTRGCTCRPGEAKKCRHCKQSAWHAKERAKGFIVWSGVDDFTWFEGQYRERFGFLHSGDSARGQLDLLAEESL
jgi:hypothetical protein